MIWRAKLREYLVAHMNEPIRFGDLVKEVMPHMPRYAAERLWHREHEDEGEVIAPVRKFKRLLLVDLGMFETEIIGRAHTRGMSWKHDTMFRVIPRLCVICNEWFVAPRKTATCSAICGGKLRWRRVADNLEDEDQPIMAQSRHPEIVSLEAIVEALRRLPDQTARQRVLTYAKHLVEAEDAEDEAVGNRPRLIHPDDQAAD